jgi:hypothetical protein
MKKQVYGRSDSQRIINFYSLVTIVIMAAVMVIYSKYLLPHKVKPFVPLVTSCQTAFQIKQNVTTPALLKEGLRLLEEGNYMLNGGFILSENSKVEEQLSLETINTLFENTIEVVSITNAQKFLNIKYEIIENEKEPQNLSLLVSFRISANEVFRMYTQINDYKPEEISQKVECMMNSFKDNAKQ